ncbi:MAG: type II secretion system F family protein [Spirochaetota bacterium]
MIYQYQALNRKGERITDIIDATNEAKAKVLLKTKGVYVTKITPAATGAATGAGQEKESSSVFNSISIFIARRMSAKNIGIFSRQLSTLLNAGMPLVRAINDIMDQTEDQYFKHIIADVKDSLESGVSFSNCLAKHRGLFTDMYINMVRVGENLGSLDSVVERLADIEEKNSILKNKIQSALWYPAFMIFFSFGIIIFLLTYVIPSLSQMFIEMGQELPLPTKIVMGASSFLSSYFWLLVVAFIAGTYAFFRYKATDNGRRQVDSLKMRIPLVKNIYNKLIVLRFTQNLGIMLSNNVDILKSFEIVRKIVGNVIIDEKISEASHKIREGSPVSKALESGSFLPKMVLGMISAGEASDNLDTMLVRIGNVYETEIDMTITNVTNMIEPLIIIFMGIVIGTIVISVMLPMLEMNLLVS